MEFLVRQSSKQVFLVGFGSQGKAWAECLRLSGLEVDVFLSREAGSFERAKDLGFQPRLLKELPAALLSFSKVHPNEPALILMLCPDLAIAPIYQEYLSAVAIPLTLVLGHGYAIYSGDLKLARSEHEAALFAPKAIGPKLEAAYRRAHSTHPSKPEHDLVAAIHASEARSAQLQSLAQAMGFGPSNRVQASFEQEAIGDLISEQGLLCGGVFTMLEWTLESMERAGIPDALIREECLRELELIAGLIRERGPASTFRAISQAAQCGTIAMRRRLLASHAKEEFQRQVEDVTSRRFTQTFANDEWKLEAAGFVEFLQNWENRLTQAEPKAGSSNE
jgi:ketol-acid reductoisomerase